MMNGDNVVNIGDVALAAGVSRSTASYALSGKRAISAEVRQRVDEAVKALGYTPNAGARALATSQTRVLGLLAQFYEDEFAPAMLQYILGVSDTARELGYDILLVTEADGARALRRVTRSRMVDGIVLLNVAQHDDRLPVLRQAPQPGALIGLPGDSSGLDVFDLDFPEAGRMMVDHFWALGHQNLLLISPPEHVVERGGAYVWRLRDAALQQAQKRGVALHTISAESRQPAVGRSLVAALDQYPDVTGLLMHNEAAAAALPSVLHTRGLEVPRDLSVIGRYSDEFARTFSLPFSSIESAPDRLGQMAVRQLVRRIESREGRDEPYVVRFISPALVDRGSTAAPCLGVNENKDFRALIRGAVITRITDSRRNAVIRLAKSARVVAFVGVVALSGALTACSSGSSSSSTAATGGGAYTWWDPYPQHNASSDWAKRVNACGTKAGVTIKRTGYDTTALTNQALLSAQEGTSPDIILLDNPAVSTLADTGMLNTTDELGLDTSNIDKNLLAAGVVKDKTYGIPIGANTLALYYNKKILDAAGVNPATITSWASLTEALAKVTADGHKGITFAGIGTEEGSFQFLPWFWGAGANLKKLDSSQAVAAVTLWKDWLAKGYAPNSVINNSQNTTWEQFLTGKFAFGENGTWQVDSAAKADFPTGIIQIPAENGGAAPAPTGGEFLTAPVQKATGRYATTKKIINCMTTTDGQVKTATTFAYYIPPTAAGQQQLLAQKPDLKTWVDAVKSAKGRTSDNLGTAYPKISQAMWTAVQKALSHSLSPKDALAEAQQAAAKATR